MKRRFSAAFLLGILLGLGGETLLLSAHASWRLERALSKDFHALFFIPSNASEPEISALDQKLTALPGVLSVHFVSKEESLSFLKSEDPRLMEELSLFSQNPMDPAFAVSLRRSALSSFPDWLEKARAAAHWSDIGYQDEEIKSILRLTLYARFFMVSLMSLLCVAAVIGVLGVFIPMVARLKRDRGRIAEILSLNARTWAIAGLGVIFGAAFSAFFAFPLAKISPWWSWPSLASQGLLLISAALSGGSLCAW